MWRGPRKMKMTGPRKLTQRQQFVVFFAGIFVLLLVPVFKTVTHLPPYMGILMGLGFLWLLTEILHGQKDEDDKHVLSVVYALRKIDTPSVLFFFGILVSIAALQSSGILLSFATWMSTTISDENLIVLTSVCCPPWWIMCRWSRPFRECIRWPTTQPTITSGISGILYRHRWKHAHYWFSRWCCGNGH